MVVADPLDQGLQPGDLGAGLVQGVLDLEHVDAGDAAFVTTLQCRREGIGLTGQDPVAFGEELAGPVRLEVVDLTQPEREARVLVHGDPNDLGDGVQEGGPAEVGDLVRGPLGSVAGAVGADHPQVAGLSEPPDRVVERARLELDDHVGASLGQELVRLVRMHGSFEQDTEGCQLQRGEGGCACHGVRSS